MKKLITTIFIFSCLVFSFSQSVNILPKWKEGDSFNLIINKKRTDIRENVSPKIIKFSTNAFIKVIKTNNDGSLTFSYTTDFNNLSENKITNEILKDFIDENKNLEILYKVSEVGNFVEIENWSEVSQKITKFTNSFGNYIKKRFDKKTLELMSWEELSKFLTSKQFIEQNSIKEIQYFHYLYGVSLIKAEPLKTETLLPNNFGGNPIKADLIVDLEEFRDDVAKISLTQRLNQNDVKEMLLAFLKKVKFSNKDFTEVFKRAEYKIDDDVTFLFNKKLGIFEKTSFTRHIKFIIDKEKGERFDEMEIVLNK